MPTPYNDLTSYIQTSRILLGDDTVTQYNKDEEEIIKGLPPIYIANDKRGIDLWASFSNLHDDSQDGLERVLQQDELDYRGWRCFAGIRKFMIDHDGNIYGAQCKVMKLGNINTTWKLNKEPVYCTIRHCACLSDIQIPKYNPKYRKVPLGELERVIP